MELANGLREAFDPDAESVENALESVTMEAFVEALFRAVEPFPMMFGDILRFFEAAGAREGQRQWRLVIGDEPFELDHFVEFEREWQSLECEFDVPAVSGHDAFLPNTVQSDLEGMEYLFSTDSPLVGQTTGLADVDKWLEAYDAGEYRPFPTTLRPERLPSGLDDAARIAMAALYVVSDAGYDRRKLLETLRSRRASTGALDQDDGLSLWMIAQNETDYWLRTTVQILGRLVAGPEGKTERFGEELRARYEALPRRRLNVRVNVEQFLRLLSLPAWRKRHEFYAVWIATEILEAAKGKGHEVKVQRAQGELRFAFRETKVADIVSTRPQVSLFAERRTPLASPIGKGRKNNVQPDYGLWRAGSSREWCSLVVEVKHYKRSNGRNFRDAMVDYAGAHPDAVVMLVNYGPVGMSDRLPYELRQRCRMVGHLNPRKPEVKAEFRKAVREQIGEPVRTVEQLVASGGFPKSVVVDSSGSMAGILTGRWFGKFAGDLARGGVAKAVLVDVGWRATVPMDALAEWIRDNKLGLGTQLAAAVAQLVQDEGWTLVVTDNEGQRDLGSLGTEIELADREVEMGAKVVAVRSGSVAG
ncbi:MAG: hypothetical protein OXH05_09205 [Acidobacteria bacterium]|nr:hypothetical protein [Acidobacteriota bacterium]